MFDRLSSSLRQVAPLIILCNLVYWFTRSSIRPAFPMLLHDELSPDTLGLLLSLQSFLPIFFSLSAGSLGDRFGHTRVLLTGAVCSTLSSLCYFLGFFYGSSSGLAFSLWIGGMALSGMAWLFIWVSLQSLATRPLAENADEKIPSVSQMIYALSLTMSIGLMLGPVVTGFTLDWWGANVFWLGHLGLSVVYGVLCLLALRMLPGKEEAEAGPEEVAASPRQYRSAWTFGVPDFVENWSKFGGRPYVTVLIVSFLVLFSVDLMASFVPAHLGSAGMSQSNIGLVMICGHTAGILLRIAMALRWVELSEKGGLTFSIAFCVLGLVLMAFLPPNFSWLLVGVAFGLGVGLGEPVGLRVIAHHAAPSRRGLALGGRVLVNRLGMCLAPYLAFKAFASFEPLVAGLLLGGSVAVAGLAAMILYSSSPAAK